MNKELFDKIVEAIKNGSYDIGDTYLKSGAMRGIAYVVPDDIEIGFEVHIPEGDPKTPLEFAFAMKEALNAAVMRGFYIQVFIEEDAEGEIQPTAIAKVYPELAAPILAEVMPPEPYIVQPPVTK